MPVKRYFEDSNREKGLRKSKKMLTGGQAKLDKNKNNKIDAEDFKMLRAGKDSMKAKKGKLVPLKKDPTKTVNPFLKRRKKLGGVKSLIGKGGRIGAAAAMLGLAGAGAAKVGQTIGRKIDEAKKKNKKMGGGMMKKPMGYKIGGFGSKQERKEAEKNIKKARSTERLRSFLSDSPKINQPMRKERYMEGKKARHSAFKKKIGTAILKGAAALSPVSGGVSAAKKLMAGRSKKRDFQKGDYGDISVKKMGGGMVGKPVGYKSGKSVKVKCKLGRNKPTKMY